MLRRSIVLLASCLVLTPEFAAAESAPKATRVVIRKTAHELELYRGDALLRRYRVAIGPGGTGFKKREGDRVTPVGHYHVTMHQPSQFHLFLRLDYPNADDRARFAKLVASGSLPRNATIGGDIGIHGSPPQVAWKPIHKTVDWTLGCIALDDSEIDEVGASVPDGTPVDIQD